jgi:oxygen-independent coproporphyrinogen-3 oxidase
MFNSLADFSINIHPDEETLLVPNPELVEKYNLQIPRYTSYPSLPHWHNMPSPIDYPVILHKRINDCSADGISIYIHLPFCESLCTYCGCNTRITVNHQVETPYITALSEEWRHYLKVFDKTPLIKEIHLGGGTPTFFSPRNLAKLISTILLHANVAKGAEFSIEAHPGVTTRKHLEVLAELGFSRISFGIQDFNPDILKAINRRQTADQVAQITRDARNLGFTSVNYDFVYGLPFQTKQDIINNAEHLKLLKPDRIAFYSYAHVPWKKGGQRKFTENNLPTAMEKLELYETGRQLFVEMGYKEIGMDHFAFPEDSLYKALEDKTLSRNFMGYVPHTPSVLIGLGCSAISDTGNCYLQNKPVVEDYIEAVNSSNWAFCKGHLLSDNDMRIKNHITNLMCYFETSWDSTENSFFNKLTPEFERTSKEGLTKFYTGHLKITPLGKHFIRNICAIIDPYISKEAKPKNQFSKSI